MPNENPQDNELSSEEKEYYISELESFVKVLRSNKDYSIQRIDILLISISGAGIYTSFELMKFVSSSKILSLDQMSSLNIHFKFTALIFTIAIIVNFISQWTAYKATSMAIDATKGEIYLIKKMKIDQKKIKALELKSNFFNKITGRTNLISISVMLCGLICMIIFIWSLF